MMAAIFRGLTRIVPLLLLVSVPAYAVDGVFEINQARVDGSGGFPFTISQPGTYRLTSNLSVTAQSASGIVITTNNVTLDLNGFAIMRTMNSGGRGIYSEEGSVLVRNGTVTGFGFDGISIQYAAVIENVRVIGNGAGIRLAGPGSVVRRCVVADNISGNGIELTSGTATENVVVGNGLRGIQAFGTNLITANVILGNTNRGIEAFGGTVTNNTSVGNGADGIYCSNCTVVANTVKGNGGYGLALAGNTGYGNNFVNLNTAGTVQGGVQIDVNVCNGSSTCP
jgi:hypothetical protein